MYVPVNAVNISYMNWSCLIVGATIIFPGLYWTFRARHKYLKEGNSILEDNIVVVDGVAVSAMEAIKD
jgi:choline transport protein